MSNQITGYARKTLPKFLIFVLLAAQATLVAPQSALAAPTFTVTSAADVVASAPLNNGVCETAPGNGVCTLRAAIMKANHYPGGGVTIQLDSLPYQLNIAKAGADDETTGDLNISQSMSVVGNSSSGTIIQGGGGSNDRVFHVVTGTLTLRRVTIQNGKRGFDCDGGGLLVDSGSALALNNSTVYSNTVDFGIGGGIASYGSLTLNTSAVTGNTANLGAGIYAAGVVTLTISTIDGNIGTGVDLEGCGGCETGTRRIYNSTVSNNTGAGVINLGINDPLIMINSTVFGNSNGGNGGGILNNSSTTSLYNVTIAYNSAGTHAAGGGVYNTNGTVNFQNTIIAKNVHGTSSPPFSASDDCSGTLTSNDYNLVSDTTGCTIAGSI